MESVEQFDYGITRTWLDEGEIAVITTQGNMAREAVDVWATLAINTVNQWPDGKPIFILHDLTHPRQSFTPYGLKRAEDIYGAIPPTIKGCSAVAVRAGPINHLIAMFVRRRKNAGQFQERIFTSRDEAIKWLRDEIKKSGYK